MRRASCIAIVVSVLAVLVGLVAPPVSAATSSGTAATVTVTGGGLSITAPTNAVLSDAAPGQTATVNLSGVQVADTRAGTAGWAASVSSTDFTGTISGAASIPASATSYTPTGTATVTGTAVVTPTARSNLSTAKTVQTATAVVGNNTATWGATFSIAIPGGALADSYAGTLVHSVL